MKAVQAVNGETSQSAYVSNTSSVCRDSMERPVKENVEDEQQFIFGLFKQVMPWRISVYYLYYI